MMVLSRSSSMVFLILLGAALGVSVVALDSLSISTTDFLVVCLVAGLCVPTFVSLLLFRRIDIFWPPMLFSLIIFIGHVLPLPGFLQGEDVVSRSWPYTFLSFESSLNQALLLAITGVVGFQSGFVLLPVAPALRRSFDIEFRSRRLWSVGFAYTLAGLGLFALGVALIGGPSALIAGLSDRIRAFAGLNYLFMATLLLPAVALVWWMYLLQRRRLLDWRFWLYAVFAFMLSGLTGSRANAFIAILAGAVLYHLLYRPIPFPTVVLLISIGSVGLVLFQLVFREYLILGDIVSLGQNPSLTDFGDRLFRSLGGDFYQIQALTIVVDAVPRVIPFQNGFTYLFLFVAPIPSSLWPGKLQFLPAPGIFTLGLWPEHWYQDGITIPPSLMGEMYLNFGAIGVLLGMIGFGALYKFAYSRARRQHSPAVLLYSFLLATMTHYIRGDFPDATVLFLIVSLPTYFAFKWVTKRRAYSGAKVG